MTNEDRIISSRDANMAIREQINSGNRIVFYLIIKGKKIAQTAVTDLTLSKTSDRDYIINQWHGALASNNHYYDDMENNDIPYHNREETLSLIAEMELKMKKYPTGTLYIIDIMKKGKLIKNDKKVMNKEEFDTFTNLKIKN